MKRLLLMGFAALFAACGDSHNGGGGTGGGGLPAVEVAYVTVLPETADFGRIGQRQQLSATAWDVSDNPIPGVAFQWESSDPSITVNGSGLATAMAVGSAVVTATERTSEAGQSGSATLTAASAVESDADGIMYTNWTAHSGYAPVLIENGKLKVLHDVFPYEQNYPTPWPHPGVEKFQWEGDRLAVLSDMSDGAGTLRVLDRHREWSILGVANVVDFQLEGNRIAALFDDGRLLVKNGIDGVWKELASGGVRQFQLSGLRTGVLYDDGRLRTRRMLGRWREQASAGVRQFQMEGVRIGALFDDGSLGVKDDHGGPLSDPDPWTEVVPGGVRHFQLEGDRIAALFDNGSLGIRDGIGASLAIVASGVRQFQLSGNRIGALHDDGSLRVRDSLLLPWKVLEDAGVRSFLLQGPYIALTTDDGRFSVGTINILRQWSHEQREVGQVTQFLPIAAVPEPPKRMTPRTYGIEQEKCRQQMENGDGHCDHFPHDAVPVPHYGRFCGWMIPSGDDLIWARQQGPMDPHDNLCRHHDNVDIYYADVRTGFADACIVQYGIAHGRLTVDGRRIVPGSNEWYEAWNFMPHLFKAIEQYNWWTGNCDEGALADFTLDTSSIY